MPRFRRKTRKGKKNLTRTEAPPIEILQLKARPAASDKEARRYLATMGSRGYSLRVPLMFNDRLLHTVYACMKNLLWDLRIDERANHDGTFLTFDPSDGLKTFIRYVWSESQVTAGQFIIPWTRLFRAWDQLGVRYDNTVDGKIKLLEHWYSLWQGYARFHQKFGLMPHEEDSFFCRQWAPKDALLTKMLKSPEDFAYDLD